MGLLDNIKSMFAQKPQASHNWRTGTKSGHLYDGSKFRGSDLYPSAWSLDNQALREKSRAAYWDSTQARALIGRMVDNTVGTGLAMESRPVWKLLEGVTSLDDKQKHEWCREVEQRFDLWANSTEPDAAGRWNLYQLQALELLNRLRDGESVQILRYSGESDRMSPLNLQVLLPEQITTPLSKAYTDSATAAGNRIIDGVEVNPMGKEIAIWVSPINDFDTIDANTSTRIPVMSNTGRRFVLHPINADTLGAVRGTPLLAPIIHELKKITDYTVAEIEAAVINAILAVWVKPSESRDASRALAGVQRRGAGEATTSDSGSTTATFDKPGLIVQSLKAGEEVQSFDTKRPNVNFGEFVKQVERSLSAGVGIPVSIMNMEATKSYSAIRAEMILFWRRIEIERAKSATQYLAPIFEAWFNEEVRTGRIQAPGYDSSPIVKRAWLNCGWNGDKLPSIDPLKEANADGVRISQGTTTRERVAMELNGSDAMENIARLDKENEALAGANRHLEPIAPSGSNMEPDQDEGDNDTSDI